MLELLLVFVWFESSSSSSSSSTESPPEHSSMSISSRMIDCELTFRLSVVEPTQSEYKSDRVFHVDLKPGTPITQKLRDFVTRLFWSWRVDEFGRLLYILFQLTSYTHCTRNIGEKKYQRNFVCHVSCRDAVINAIDFFFRLFFSQFYYSIMNLSKHF